ncbi:hemophore-related protein [Actinomycetota bacterium Odt1-20B]
MKNFNTMRRTIRTVTVSGVAAGIGLLGAVNAAADAIDPVEPLLKTDCSYEQIDRAAQDNPDAAVLFAAMNMDQKTELRDILDTPLDQRQPKIHERRAELQKKIDENPELAEAQSNPNLAKVAGVFEDLAVACHSK